MCAHVHMYVCVCVHAHEGYMSIILYILRWGGCLSLKSELSPNSEGLDSQWAPEAHMSPSFLVLGCRSIPRCTAFMWMQKPELRSCLHTRDTIDWVIFPAPWVSIAVSIWALNFTHPPLHLWEGLHINFGLWNTPMDSCPQTPAECAHASLQIEVNSACPEQVSEDRSAGTATQRNLPLLYTLRRSLWVSPWLYTPTR